MIYKHPLKVDVCDEYEQDVVLYLVENEPCSRPESYYINWELRILSDKSFTDYLPYNNVLVTKYVHAKDLSTLVNTLSNPEEAFRIHDTYNKTLKLDPVDRIYCGHAIEVNRYSNVYEFVFYCEYHQVFFVANAKQLKNCFSEVVTRKAINAL